MYYCCGYKDHSRPPAVKLANMYGCYVTIWEAKVTHTPQKFMQTYANMFA